MRIVVLALALALGACSSLQSIGTGLQIVTQTYVNPISKDDLYKVEAVMTIAATGLVAYRRACLRDLVDAGCRKRIADMQTYTIPMQSLVVQLRQFVKNNDQVNARVAYDQFIQLYANLKPLASAVGINIGAAT